MISSSQAFLLRLQSANQNIRFGSSEPTAKSLFQKLGNAQFNQAQFNVFLMILGTRTELLFDKTKTKDAHYFELTQLRKPGTKTIVGNALDLVKLVGTELTQEHLTEFAAQIGCPLNNPTALASVHEANTTRTPAYDFESLPNNTLSTALKVLVYTKDTHQEAALGQYLSENLGQRPELPALLSAFNAFGPNCLQ